MCPASGYHIRDCCAEGNLDWLGILTSILVAGRDEPCAGEGYGGREESIVIDLPQGKSAVIAGQE